MIEDSIILSEFSHKSLIGGGVRKLGTVLPIFPPNPTAFGERLSTAFFLAAVVVVALSCFGGSAKATLLLASTKGPKTISFGYWFELNAALSYLVVAPIFIRSAWLFVRRRMRD